MICYIFYVGFFYFLNLGIWNGANFYIDVFTKSYHEKILLLKKDLDEKGKVVPSSENQISN
jgi:hypothetical protein